VTRTPLRAPAPDAGEVAAFASARAAVLDRIARACARARRPPTDVQLLAVSKTVPVDRLRAAVAGGLEQLGENRVQDAVAKFREVPGVRWHLVGPLQSNKARRAVELFETIQTVDSVGLARRLAALSAELGRSPLRVLVQVNVDADPAKAGFRPADVQAALTELASLGDLRIEGLMTVGRMTTDPEDARPTFRALSELSRSLRGRDAGLGHELSMGMSDDFDVAIEEGATIVRIGRALFGERPPG